MRSYGSLFERIRWEKNFIIVVNNNNNNNNNNSNTLFQINSKKEVHSKIQNRRILRLSL